ncbi:hypothetical protein CRG98_033703 [Punica granatum]|uniref:Uncharacterized protein n=1 Tax=Punica granatum TaxID=22663 RepID=A0A2I0IPH8_PUNGR|nr:hypothetical protein CRG98_033703 [Punica granatum]
MWKLKEYDFKGSTNQSKERARESHQPEGKPRSRALPPSTSKWNEPELKPFTPPISAVLEPLQLEFIGVFTYSGIPRGTQYPSDCALFQGLAWGFDGSRAAKTERFLDDAVEVGKSQNVGIVY